MLQEIKVHHRAAIAISALLISSPAFAEVVDKEPSLGTMWAWALGFNAGAFLLEAIKPRLGLAVLPIAIFFAWGGYSELTAPYVGPAILDELGRSYVRWSYVSLAAGLFGPLCVVGLRRVWRR